MSRANLTPAAGIQTGKGVTIGAIAAGATSNIAVTFPQPYPTAPFVKCTSFNSRLSDGMVSVSTTGFTVAWSNWSGANMPGTTFDWVAVRA